MLEEGEASDLDDWGSSVPAAASSSGCSEPAESSRSINGASLSPIRKAATELAGLRHHRSQRLPTDK